MDLPLDARTAAARAAAPTPARDAARAALVVVLHPGRAARLTRPQGVHVSVDAGRLRLTVAGRGDDVFFGPGQSVEIDDDGLLVVESDGTVPAVLRLGRARPPGRDTGAGVLRVHAAGLARRAGRPLAVAFASLRRAWRARTERRVLLELDDRTLRDIGASDALRSEVRAERDAVARDRPRRTVDRCTWWAGAWPCRGRRARYDRRVRGLLMTHAGERGDCAAELLELMAESVPLLTVVSPRHRDAWARFTGGATVLPAEPDAVRTRLDGVPAPRAAAA
jgi:uncharacterized protein YjiS (DUF1127 family)